MVSSTPSLVKKRVRSDCDTTLLEGGAYFVILLFVGVATTATELGNLRFVGPDTVGTGDGGVCFCTNRPSVDPLPIGL